MATALHDLSNALAEVVQTAAPSVVRVEARPRLPVSGMVWTADGVIVTAHHVVETEESLHVGLEDGRAVPAALVGRDATTDLAVLKAEAHGLAVPTWAEATTLKVGHIALALGRPGASVMATMGIVSALDGEWRTPAGGLIDPYVQASVTMYPGFSGGPLVDAQGRLVGLNTSGILRGVTPVIPVATLRRVAEALLAHGRVRQGYLGIGAQPVRLPQTLAQQLGQHSGLVLLSVEPNSPAERGGLLLGDTIVGMAGQRVTHMEDVLSVLAGDVIGRAIPVQIVRGGEVRIVTVMVGERR